MDDDDDDTAASDDDSIDPYDSMAEFFYSHGLLNRGRIEADGLYDSVNWSGGNYTIDRPATALKLDGGVIHGGIYNSGTISAQAYNADATAIYLESGALTDGLRDDGSIFLNEGTIRAITTSHTKSYHNATRDSFAATAVMIRCLMKAHQLVFLSNLALGSIKMAMLKGMMLTDLKISSAQALMIQTYLAQLVKIASGDVKEMMISVVYAVMIGSMVKAAMILSEAMRAMIPLMAGLVLIPCPMPMQLSLYLLGSTVIALEKPH